MTSFSLRLLSLVMLTLSGCSCGEVALVDAGSDAAALDAAAVDAAPELDAVLAVDAPLTGDVDGVSDAPFIDAASVGDASGSDAPSVCGNNIDDGFGGVCDGRGMAACMMWATRTGGSMASAICLSATGGCARASECTGGTVDTCRCGSEPACAANEVCMSGFAGYSCVCAP